MKLLKKLLFLIIGLIFLFLIITVFYSNKEVVQVSLLPSFPFSMQLGLLIVLTFLVGLICGALILFTSLMGQKVKTSMANRRLKKVEREVEGLRAAELQAATQLPGKELA